MRRKIEVAENITSSLREFISRVTVEGVPSTQQSIYDGKRNGIYDMDGVNVKRFGRPNVVNKLIYSTFRKSKARRSYENAVKLTSLGINTPTPYGYSEVREGLLLTDSYYFCEQIEASTMRDWSEILLNEELVNSFCGFAENIYKRGVYHKDFSPGNILYKREKNGKYTLFLVDINRMSFGKPSYKHLNKMFSVISIDPAVNKKISSKFAKTIGLDESKFVSDTSVALAGYLRKKRFFKRIKRLFGRKKK